jgi:hypothetical protein
MHLHGQRAKKVSAESGKNNMNKKLAKPEQQIYDQMRNSSDKISEASKGGPMELEIGDNFYTRENDTYIKITGIRLTRLHMRNRDPIVYVKYDYKTKDGKQGREEKSLDGFMDQIINGD